MRAGREGGRATIVGGTASASQTNVADGNEIAGLLPARTDSIRLSASGLGGALASRAA
jgi:hypothetical protein